MAAELERIYLSKYLTLDHLGLITAILLTNFLDSDGELSFICSKDFFFTVKFTKCLLFRRIYIVGEVYGGRQIAVEY